MISGKYVQLRKQRPRLVFSMLIHHQCRFKSHNDLFPTDGRRHMPRFSVENFPHNLTLASQFESIANKHPNATAAQVALAWILARHPNMVPIPGSKTPARLEENAGGAWLQLSEEDLKVLDDAVAVADVRGGRKPAFAPHLLNDNCIPLEEWKGE